MAIKLKALRSNAGMTIADLSRVSGVSAKTISNIETGRVRRMQGGTARKLASALNTDVGRLLLG